MEVGEEVIVHKCARSPSPCGSNSQSFLISLAVCPVLEAPVMSALLMCLPRVDRRPRPLLRRFSSLKNQPSFQTAVRL
jgi:hypothetical protein